jgi:gluconolactonase
MKRLCLFFNVVLVMSLGTGLGWAQMPVDKPVVRLDPALDSIISPDAKIEVVKRGFGFTEGQIWIQHAKEGYLLFVDIPNNVINKLTPDGKVSVFLDHAGYPGPITGFEMLTVGSIKDNGLSPKDPLYKTNVMVNIGPDGLGVDPQGRIVVCTYVGRSMMRIEKDGKRTILADRYEGKRFNGPNDVTIKKNGTIYFTDTNGGLRGGAKDPTRGVENAGVYMIKDGKVTYVVMDMPSVNGLALSADEKYLYVNGANKIRRYDVQPDDTVTNSQPFIDLTADPAWGYTDGMRVDSKGNVWVTGPGGIWIISPEGKHLGTILAPGEKIANFGFGDPDWKTVYLGGRTGIYKIRVNTPGIPCHTCTSN